MCQINISNYYASGTIARPPNGDSAQNCSTFPTLPLPAIHTFTRAQAHAGLIELVKRFDDRLIIRNRRGELLTHLGQVIAAVMADDYEIGGGR